MLVYGVAVLAGLQTLKYLLDYGILGGAMFRGFAIVSNAMGANFHERRFG